MVTAFTTAPVLGHFNHDREVIIEPDSPEYVSAGVLSHYDNDGVLHLMGYFSKKHSPAECNYDIYDKELMAIIEALEEWIPECEGAEYPLKFITDHKNLQYVISKMLLNRWQAQWWEFLTRFDYEIVYQPSKSNEKADDLMRRLGDLPEWRDDRSKTMERVVQRPQNLRKQLRLLADSPAAQGRPSIPDHMTKAYETEPLPGKILEAIWTNTRLQENIIGECMEEGGWIRYRGNWYLPDSDGLRLCIVQAHHHTALVWHPGQAMTCDLLDRRYYWKEMGNDVD